jgi:hypothetical protein
VFGSLKGKGGEDFEKEKKKIWEGRVFHHYTKFPDLGGTQKMYWRGILEGLHKSYKSNLCCYNTLNNIKNILIITIYHFLQKKISKMVKDFSIFPLNSPPLQTPKQSLRNLTSMPYYCDSNTIKS